jgi:hypothetical protein
MKVILTLSLKLGLSSLYSSLQSLFCFWPLRPGRSALIVSSGNAKLGSQDAMNYIYQRSELNCGDGDSGRKLFYSQAGCILEVVVPLKFYSSYSSI